MKHSYLKHLLLCLCLSIGTNAFAYDAKIDGIYYYFSGNEAIVTYQEMQSTYPWHITSDYSGTVVIPSSITYNGKTYSVTSIGGGAFSGCSSLTSVTIPNSVTSIGGGAFSGCSSLTSVTIPNSVTSIGNNPFYGTVWYNAQPDGILYLDDWLLGYKGTEPTGNLTINNGTRGIAGYAFYCCSSLRSITIPNSVTYIGSEAFVGCHSLTSITIPNSVTYIGSEAFVGCHSLTSITIPYSVTEIVGNVFQECMNLSSIKVETGNVVYDSRGNCNAIIETGSNTLVTGCKNTIIPNSVTSIGDRAFQWCSLLTSITIPHSVTSIGHGAFDICLGLSSVSIGSGVTSIGDYAFSCVNLTFVRMEQDLPIKIEANTFTNHSNAILCVPKGSISSYQVADYWKEFKNIVDNIVEGDVNLDEQVNVVDVVDIARFVVGTPADTFVEVLADFNNDNAVNLGDAVVLVNNIAGDQNFVKAWSAPDRITANDALSLTERDGNLSVKLDNERSYTAFQFDLYVPVDVDVTQMMLNAERKQGHQLLYNKVEEGHYRVAALSTSNNDFDGNDGELLNIALNEIYGEEVNIRNIHFFDAEGHDYQFEDVYGSSPTSIRQIDNGQLTIDNEIYDLQGRKRTALQRGINIVGGKMIIY